MNDYPIKDCDYCEHAGKAYTSRDGETICESCLSKYPTSSRDCRIKIQELEKEIEVDNKNLAEMTRLLQEVGIKNEELEKQLANVSKFPTMMRKMWSGGEVQEWIDKQLTPPAKEDE